MINNQKLSLTFALILSAFMSLHAQISIKGKVIDATSGEPLIGANVTIANSPEVGTVTDFDGIFSLEIPKTPTILKVSYIGFSEMEYTVSDPKEKITIRMGEDPKTIDIGVEIKGQRVSDKQKAAPLTVESLDAIAIKQTASNDFYSGLGALKGVDLTTASLGFTIINTRGFNSTSPVRSLQVIDGVDNQSPGLNFSLGNFLGSSELDIQKVDLVVGASGAFYGPNAFNGVISMETKNPFYTKGLSASLKFGERDLFETAVRFADAKKNKKGEDVFGYKINLFYMKAYDWEADSDDPVFDTTTGRGNPGRYDQVNTYGDEYKRIFDESNTALGAVTAGLGTYHRRGYREIDVVDYNTRNAKGNVGLYYRLKPSLKEDSPELVYGFNIGNGTTVYQGENRFSLRNITFFQNKIELRKRDKYFLRFYQTQEDAGDSYDPYFTSLLLQQRAKDDASWYSDYIAYWQSNVRPQMLQNGYPNRVFDPNTGTISFDEAAAQAWLANNQEFLTQAHASALRYVDTVFVPGRTEAFYVPGTERFNRIFNEIISRKSNSRDVETGGSRFFDRSALYNLQGEYKLAPKFVDEMTVGFSGRLYTPNSEGTIFSDTAGTKITLHEFGFYAGIEEKYLDDKLKFNATLRADKNQNFDWLMSPAASLVYTPSQNNYFRLSFSSAIRNPTLSDQYLFLNVGPAILSGNLTGRQNLITPESFLDYLATFNSDTLEYFSFGGIKPERVRSIELGYRTTLFDNTYVDASAYYSRYRDFIGFVIGVDSEFNSIGLPENTQAFRYATNSTNAVTTQGFSIGINHYFKKYFMLAGNYSWNKLNKLDVDDPIIPAFNTPEHKYNISISGRDVEIKLGNRRIKNVGFNVNYRWVQGFIFEGSPQFTGFVPSYGLVDAQVNYGIPRINLTIKAGASNLLNNKVIQTYGGPRIGRMAYISALYEFKKK